MNERVLRLLEFDTVVETVIGYCVTPYGKELAVQLAPLATIGDIRTALSYAEEGATILRLRGELPLPVGGTDVRSALHRARIGAVLGANELVAIAMTANRSRRTERVLQELAERAEIPLVVSVCPALVVPKSLEDEIFACLDEDGVVLDHASPLLAQIRRQIRVAQDRMKRVLDEMVRSPSLQRYLQDTIVTLRGDRYCLAVKAEHQSQIRGIIHDSSASGQTVFVEPERVLQFGNEMRRLAADEEREIERIFTVLSEVVAQHADGVLAAVQSIGTLDFAVAKGKYAKQLRATSPSLVEEPRLRIRGGRHPLLDPDRAVPMDLRLGDEFWLLVITGPNTGGKTVALKTTGLLTIMALSGLMVPAEEGSEIGFFTEVFADIGDEQSIAQNLSTFSSHMTNIVRILHAADRRSLVLFDELGAGTDPTEGAALAMAILDDLRIRAVRTIGTTHYSELKAYAYTTPNTMNASVEFDVETLAPTYRLLMGVPGRSNAFAIAGRLGLPEDLIRSAGRKLSSQDVRVEDLISQLQASVIATREEEAAATRARREAERALAALQESQLRADHDHKARRDRAEDELRTQIKQRLREAETILVELRENQRAGMRLKDHEIVDARKRLAGLAPDAPLQTLPKTARRLEIAVGDDVRVLSLGGQKATVLEAPIGQSEAVVAVGAMKMKVDRAQLELLQKGKKEKHTTSGTSMVVRSTDGVNPSIDVRGMTVEEAAMEVDQYIDRALLAGYHQVMVIHGKGTGALRMGLTKILRGHSRIRTTRPGVEGEGGSGVTVIDLQ